MKTRHHLRLPLHGAVMFATDEFVGEGTIIDVGIAGCAVQSGRVPAPHEYLRLHILSPNEAGSFTVHVAKVRWTERDRFGVEFLSFSQPQAVTVERLFQALRMQSTTRFA